MFSPYTMFSKKTILLRVIVCMICKMINYDKTIKVNDKHLRLIHGVI